MARSRALISSGSRQPKEVIQMFYWGLLIGLIIGANIGIVVAGLLSRSKKDERAALWKQDASDYVANHPIKRKESSPQQAARHHPSD
jgi:hypothetical protein